jgi:L-iditol 2-dehydrogenase
VFHLPDSIDGQAAPLIQVLTTCLRAQRLVDIFPAQSVVVMGLGVAGQLHVQLAKARGASPVIGVTRSAWKRRLAEELGADVTLSSGPDAARGIAEATDGRGADLIIESTGTMSVVAASVSMVRLGGTLLLYGIMTATEGALPFYQLYYKELAIVNSRAAKGEDYPPSIDLVARGAVQLKPLISHVVPLAELGKAIHMLESDADQRMKVILESR